MNKILLIILMFMFSCNPDPVVSDIALDGTVSECGIDGFYNLNEIWFTEEDTVTLKVNVVYFLNNSDYCLSEEEINHRFNIVSGVYEKFAGITFRVDKIEYVYGIPVDNPKALEAIINLEKVIGMDHVPIRDKFRVVQYDLWNEVYKPDNKINVLIFNEVDSRIGAIAGGIGSTYLAIELNYLEPSLFSLEHEFGHCFGLLHTHTKDNTNGLTNTTGDLVCDTYTCPDSLYKAVRRDCVSPKLKGVPTEEIDKLKINIESYTVHQCREEFTPVQSKRMRKTIETTNDISKCTTNYDSKIKPRLWRALKK